MVLQFIAQFFDGSSGKVDGQDRKLSLDHSVLVIFAHNLKRVIGLICMLAKFAPRLAWHFEHLAGESVVLEDFLAVRVKVSLGDLSNTDGLGRGPRSGSQGDNGCFAFIAQMSRDGGSTGGDLG
ncbi:hypothetical protein AC579_2936 [Pseudocercospora musae]|uniref:Uncharacterized protein n=1 Tax=Pseudocercospora musae TaxID=113226 RepID=A0A139IU96_9PEZI|nr:hypothetical protein AC579_2936 [Pseudocercospora musae]